MPLRLAAMGVQDVNAAVDEAVDETAEVAMATAGDAKDEVAINVMVGN